MSKAINDQNKFNFFIPANIEKGKDKDGNEITWIDGIASSSDVEDSDGETLFPVGFDYTPLLTSGFFNYNHKANITSKAIVGQPTEAKIVNSGKDFYVKGFIYPNEEGKNIISLAETLKKYSPDRKIGFSIEGTATARDPFDKKKITGAVVTGIALTVSPKNKNTLMNIIKGEYAEPFFKSDEINIDSLVDEYNQWIGDDSHRGQEGNVKEFLQNYHEDNIDLLPELITAISTKKAIDVAAISPAMPESVEHYTNEISNKNAKEFGNVIKKSDIYTLIINKYNSPIAETKKIYSFVEKINQNLFSMNTATTTPITEEVIQKSFDLLDEAIALIKGQDAASVEGQEGNTSQATDNAIVKSEEEKALEQEQITKSKDTASILMKAGMEKDAACDIMVKGGISLVAAQGAWESVLADANANKQGGDISTVATPIVKAEELVDITGTIKKSLAPVNTAIEKGFEGLNTLVKSLQEQNGTLLKSNEELNGRLEKLEGQNPGRKSISTVTAIDRFSKGNESTELKPGEEIINIDSKSDLAKLVNRLDAENETYMAKGNDADPALVKAIESIEICSVVPEAMYPRLRSMGIILQTANARA